MTRSLLLANLPCLIALAVGFGLLWVLKRGSGARWNWRRLRGLHRCQDGGVQSLAFVITLPMFIMVVMFIVQMSQLMVGITVVHYSAFASARSAIVWLPAEISEDEPENRMLILSHREQGDQFFLIADPQSDKYRQIRAAAVLGCASVCPSRDLGIAQAEVSRDGVLTAEAARRMYRSLVPTSVRNGRINPRIWNKISYSDRNTFVIVSWRDAKNGRGRETFVSPTYNPRNHPNPDVPWEPGEVGWQDAVTVHVFHRFALLPGPGRLLARYLVPRPGVPNDVYERVTRDAGSYSEPVYSVMIPASATLTNEGMKSVRPYRQEVR
ncbi:MAG: TadE/TadG family type IV pilus assembly protein [Planctomycetaceae bacterium]